MENNKIQNKQSSVTSIKSRQSVHVVEIDDEELYIPNEQKLMPRDIKYCLKN
jgi:hypothetical protein